MNKNKSGHSMALYAGIFFISMSALILQVALTRVFAIMMWYHFTYLIISLALLGFGASGSLLTLLKLDNRTLAYANKLLIITSFLFGATIIISFFSITRIKIDTFVIWKSQKDFFSLIAIFLILSVPFLMGGLAIGSCLTRFSNSASRIYFIDLIGAAAGAIASPFILEKQDKPPPL